MIVMLFGALLFNDVLTAGSVRFDVILAGVVLVQFRRRCQPSLQFRLSMPDDSVSLWHQWCPSWFEA